MSGSNENKTPEVVASNGAPAASAKPPEASNVDPHWLSDRLNQARRAQLKELGAENVDDVKAALADLKSKREAEKTAADKAAEALQRAASAESSATALKAVVTEYAARQMFALTDSQKAAVTAIAGDDPALQLKAITALQPTWSAALAAAAPKVEPTAADTAPPANAPAPATVSTPNHRAQYDALRKSNPFAAALYANEHGGAIYGDG